MVTRVMLKNYDYFPYEVQRCLASKDARYMVNFDWKNPNRQLYSKESGKSLA